MAEEMSMTEGAPVAEETPVVERPAVMEWYVVHAYSGYEKRVQKMLEERIARADEALRGQFGRVLVPAEEVVEMRSGQKRRSERKFFPGYVLVEMILTDESQHLVKGVSNILGFITGDSGAPVPIAHHEVDQILEQVRVGTEQPRPKVLFEPGEVVRVVDGPFKDFNGVVEEVNYEKSRLRVAVLIFGRSTPVELEFVQVEKD